MTYEANSGQSEHLAQYTSKWDLHFDPFFRCADCGWVEGGDGPSEPTRQARIRAHQNLPPEVHATMIETHQKLLAGTLFTRSDSKVDGQSVIPNSNGSSVNSADGTPTVTPLETVAEM